MSLPTTQEGAAVLLLEYCLLHAYVLALKSRDGMHRHIDAQTP